MTTPRNPRRRAAKLFVAVLTPAVFALAAPLPVRAATPADLSASNRPTPIEGAENGRVPADELVTAAPGCRVARDAGPSTALLLRQARSRNIPLGTEDCYRPIDDQVTLYARNTSSGGPCTARPSTYPDGRPRGTSNHGWGKAIDFSQTGTSFTFRTAGYRFLTEHAEAAGWVHPDWAGPGMTCAEPWHWEWVGDGGTQGGPVVRADVVAAADTAPSADDALLLVTGLGAVESRGTTPAPSYGSLTGTTLSWVIVDATTTASGRGYWMLGGDGGVFTFGDARFFGSTGNVRLNAPAVAMAATQTGNGYWFVAADGGVFTFGDAAFFGSLGGKRLNAPVVGIAPTPTGNGYWLIASDGGVFTFGDARFWGSTGDIRLAEPIVGMAATTTGNGYWLAAEDGGVFTFGDAVYRGSAVTGERQAPFVDFTPAANGYRLVGADGTVIDRSR
jgi:LAS superfamily LD-carboxypeptidase LdcB